MHITTVYAAYIRMSSIGFSMLPFNIPFVMLIACEKGRMRQSAEKNTPIISAGKYIPLVNATSCIAILETPDAERSDEILPIKIPREINSIDRGREERMA